MRRLDRWLATAACVAALVGVVAPPAAAAPEKGEVGGPPTFPIPPVPPGEGTQTTPALVIGEGAALGRPFEIVAHGWTPPRGSGSSFPRQLCVWVAYSRQESQFGMCGTVLRPAFSEVPIWIDSFIQRIAPKRLRDTELSGLLSPETTSVELVFRRQPGEQPFRPAATVAQVSGELQRELDQPAPFGYFVARVRGLVKLRSIRALAFDSAGRLIGSKRGLASHRAY